MRITRRDGEETRGRIIEAAAAVFAAEGYRAGTVEQIAQAAGVNHAAINYHFGGKDALYRQVWKHAQDACLEKYPLAPPAGTSLPVEEQLRRFIRSMILRHFDPGPPGHLTRLLAYEILDPQPAIDDLRCKTMQQHFRRLEEILQQVLGTEMSEEVAGLCQHTIMAPCVGLGMRLIHHPEAAEVQRLRRSDPQQLAEGIFRFAWAGLQDLHQRHRGNPPAAHKETSR